MDRLLAAPRKGRSATLLVRGEAGIGKTALLRYAIGRAEGMRVLATSGVASESELPFAGLSALLRPLLDRIGRLPGPQASALEGALALGPPVHTDRFAISLATLNLLSLASESQPVLVAVDDVHWLDVASAEALVFATRRLSGEPVAALLTVREGERSPVDVSGLPELVLGGLDREASLELLRGYSSVEVAPEVAEQLVTVTRGNPLALIEVPASLSDEQRSGRAPLYEPLPVGRDILRAYSRRIGGLPTAAREALLVAAASDTPALDNVVRALEELGIEPAALEHAEAEGLIAVDDLVFEFRHPLLRSSVYSSVTPARRRAAHRALAAAHEAGGADGAAERRAWHLSAAALGPDRATAALLADTGARSSDRHAYVAAARAYERAARLSPEPEQTAGWLLSSAEAWQQANRPREAVALLEDAQALATGPPLRLRIRRLRAKIDTWRGPAAAAYELLIGDAESVERSAPEEAASMSADAVLCAIVSGDIRLAVACGRRAYELAQRVGGHTELVAALQLGKALILSGESQSGHSLILRCRELLDESNVLERADELSQTAPALMTVEEFALTDHILTRLIESARAANALGLLPYCLGALSELDVRLGRFTAAYANGLASVDLAREAAQEGQLSYNLARLARVEAAQGRVEMCRVHAREALELATSVGFGSTHPFARSALGLLALGIGDPVDAAEQLEQARHWTDEIMGMLEPARVQCAPDLVEAYVHLGRLETAIDRLEELESRAERSTARWSRAASSRCRGLVSGDSEFEEQFEEALEWHDRAPASFERARTELCFGERLRRTRRRADARAHLRSAWEGFEQLGASAWASRARAELTATGLTVRSRRMRLSDELTPQELQVAHIVAGGATNKEAAAALFLTPKTIEFHLAKIYRKLGVRSRTQLAHRMSTSGSWGRAAA